MLLSDTDIDQARHDGDLSIEPWRPSALQPSSVDLHLGSQLLVPSYGVRVIDVARVPVPHTTRETMVQHKLHRGDFVLGCTVETVTVGDSLAGVVEGISSLGRLGLMVHVTAGFIDPGFSGQITLEIVNCAPWHIVLRAGMRICQIAFQPLRSPARQQYGTRGHYQHQSGPVESRYRMTYPQTTTATTTTEESESEC